VKRLAARVATGREYPLSLRRPPQTERRASPSAEVRAPVKSRLARQECSERCQKWSRQEEQYEPSHKARDPDRIQQLILLLRFDFLHNSLY